MFNEKDVASAAESIRQASTIAISGHTNPDGDALGSALGLALAIKATFPEKKVTTLLADECDVPRIYKFLPGADKLISSTSYNEEPDLFISVDTPTRERLKDSANVLDRARFSIAIDHHPHIENFANIDITVSSASATGIIIWYLIEPLGLVQTPEVATNLMCAVMTDTGRFQYQSVTADTFLVASQLVDAGASPSNVALHVYQSRTVASLKLESIVLSRIQVSKDGRVGWSYVTEQDFQSTGAIKAESDGLIDVVRSIDGVEAALLARGEKDGTTRCSLRSKSDADVSKVAQKFGGGGHRAAAGLTFEGSVEETIELIIPELEVALHIADKNKEQQNVAPNQVEE